MADNGAREDRRNGHDQTAIAESDELLMCTGCDGRGRYYDRWGSWDCGLCHGLGYVTRSFWDAWVAGFPPYIQAHLRSQRELPVYRGNGHAKEAPCASRIYE